MSRRSGTRSCGVAAALLVSLLALRAAANPATPAPAPHLRMRTPARVCTLDVEPPRCRDVPPGRFLDEPSWEKLDLEIRRLQDAEHRLTAENTSLRNSASSWRPGWRTITAALLVGMSGVVAAFVR